MDCVKFYVGKLGEEQLLFSASKEELVNYHKNDFVFYNDEVYKILYTMHDFDYKEYDVFMRVAVEEDF